MNSSAKPEAHGPEAAPQRAPVGLETGPKGTPHERHLGWIALGWLCFALGLAGAVLPVMPTTPFMLLALWAFAKGSKRLHDWLYHHPRFGPPMQRWCKHRVIPLHAKVVALTAMASSMIFLSVTQAVPPLGMFFASMIVAYGAVFILSKPSHAPASDTGD